MISKRQSAVIYGSLLGDGSIVATSGGKRFRFAICHSDQQKDYIFWKYKILKDLVGTAPKFYARTNSWYFRTLSFPEFAQLRSLFYIDRQKIVPKTVESILEDPEVLAIWYMDDGNLRREYGKVYGCILNSHSFSQEDNQKLSKWLWHIYRARSTLQKNHGKYRLYFGANSWKRLCNAIAPHIISTMRYKLS